MCVQSITEFLKDPDYNVQTDSNNTNNTNTGHSMRNIKLLALTSMKISAAGAGLIGNMLTCNRSLRHINLSNNNLGTAGLRFLLEGLRANSRHLKSISLRNNNLDSESVRVFAEILNVHSGVHTFDISYNDEILSDAYDVLSSVMSAESCCNRWKSVCMGGYKTGEEELKSLTSWMRTSTSIEEITIYVSK